MTVRNTLALWAALPVCAVSAVPAVAQVWPAAAQELSPPPEPSPSADEPVPVPPSVLRVEPGSIFLEPPAVPEPPIGLEAGAVGKARPDDAAGGLTLDTLLSLACQNNPTLRQARLQVAGELATAMQAGLYPNPTLTYQAEQIGVEGTAGEFHGGLVQQEIVTADKRKISREKYLARARSAEFLAVAQQFRVCNDVRVHYWRALGEQQVLGIRRELLKSAEDSLVTTRELYNLGQATRADVHRANVELQRARLDVLQAENESRRSSRKLVALVGCDLSEQGIAGELDGAPIVMDYSAALERLLRESPELHAARAKYQADRITVRREQVEPIPNFFVQGGSGYNFEARETVGAFSLQLEVPLFDRNQGTIRQAEADLARQRAEIQRIEQMLKDRLADRFAEYLTAVQHVSEFRTVILPEARAAYATELDSYQEDRQDWPAVLDAQQDYFDLRRIYIDHLVNWRENEAMVQGFLLDGGLQAAQDATPPGHIDATPQPR